MINKRSTKSVKNNVKSSNSMNGRKNKCKENPNNTAKNIQEYINASQASATKRAYASDLRHFLEYGGKVPCSPRRMAKYLVESANDGLAVATIERRVIAIHKAHVDQNHQSPARTEIVRKVLQGIRRTFGTKQRQVKPLLKNELLAVLEAIKSNFMPVRAARDCALLLIGFASAMRRSELIGICVEHLNFSAEGVMIEMPVSKTDQERCGRTVFIPRASSGFCPVKALEAWLNIANIRVGNVFRAVNRYGSVSKIGLTSQSVALILKTAVMQIGVNSKNYSGHSLRSGYCTSAAEQGLNFWQIREQTGHKSNLMLEKYIRSIEKRKNRSLL